MNKQIKLNDGIVKLIGIPLLGLLIPNLTGLIAAAGNGMPQVLLHYICFMAIAWIIWEGNVQLMYTILRKFEWRYHKMHRNILMISGASFLFSATASFLLLGAWMQVAQASENLLLLLRTCAVVVGVALFITNLYEIVILNREAEFNWLKVEQLNLAKAQAELEALKNQIDPHFLFNALNTLSYLIPRNSRDARLYNDTLARVYRYILNNRDKDLVLLSDELEFISNYFHLLKIRFRKAIDMEIEINDLESAHFLVPPISLQMLVENAIKHNQFSESAPLLIHISISSSFILVRNQVYERQSASGGSGIGLSNLRNRYRLITQKNIVVEKNARQFSIKLPVLKYQSL